MCAAQLPSQRAAETAGTPRLSGNCSKPGALARKLLRGAVPGPKSRAVFLTSTAPHVKPHEGVWIRGQIFAGGAETDPSSVSHVASSLRSISSVSQSVCP